MSGADARDPRRMDLVAVVIPWLLHLPLPLSQFPLAQLVSEVQSLMMTIILGLKEGTGQRDLFVSLSMNKSPASFSFFQDGLGKYPK